MTLNQPTSKTGKEKINESYYMANTTKNLCADIEFQYHLSSSKIPFLTVPLSTNADKITEEFFTVFIIK